MSALQAEVGGSGSQGSRHSPGAGAESPAKKQKTSTVPTQPASTGVGEPFFQLCCQTPN